jgi:iron complex outermembrane receptor protein
MICHELFAAGATVVALILASTSASGQAAGTPAESPSEQLEQIDVTAEKRSANLENTPIAITAVTGTTLAAKEIQELRDLKELVPNMQMTTNTGVGQISIRGVGISNVLPTAEGSIAVNVDGVYVSRPTGITSSFYDVADIEVLRGPQGTLYGRNATGGSINIASQMPTKDWSGYTRTTLGNYDTFDFEGAVGGAITDSLLVRVAAFSQNHAGYGQNIVTGHGIDDKHANAFRVILVSTPTDTFKATLIGDYYIEDDASGSQHYFAALGHIGVPGQSNRTPVFQRLGGYVNSDLIDETASIDPKFYLSTGGIAATLNWDLAPVTITSISAYRAQRETFFGEVSTGYPTTGYISNGEPAHQWSEEFRANYDHNQLHATGGIYYFTEHDAAEPQLGIYSLYVFNPAVSPGTFVRQNSYAGYIDTDSKAAFGQVKFDLSNALSITAGGRYTYETKLQSQRYGTSLTDQPGPPFTIVESPITYPLVTREAGFHSFTPKGVINYQLGSDTFLYASYSEGFRAGTFDLASGPAVPALKPELLKDYESGIKTTLFNNRLRANLTGFYYDYTNMQISQSNGITIVVQNAGSAKIYGAEAEITALPTPKLEFDVAAGYLHSAFGPYSTTNPAQLLLRPLNPPNPATVNYQGNQLPNAPQFTLHVGTEYTFGMPVGDLVLRGEVDYQSVNYLSPDNFAIESQPAFAKINAFLTYNSSQNWKVGLYGRNLTNKITKESDSISSTFGSVLKGDVSFPRTFGVQAAYKFDLSHN